jgi:hypothetical protein
MELKRYAAERYHKTDTLAYAVSRDRANRLKKKHEPLYGVATVSCRVEGKGSKVRICAGGLEGVSADLKTKHRYFIEMDVPELAEIVASVMKAAPSRELFEATLEAATSALPARTSRRKA